MKIETRAYRSGSYAGRQVWHGKFRIVECENGFELGWCVATNNTGNAIAYEDKEAALTGAQFCGEQFAKGFSKS